MILSLSLKRSSTFASQCGLRFLLLATLTIAVGPGCGTDSQSTLPLSVETALREIGEGQRAWFEGGFDHGGRKAYWIADVAGLFRAKKKRLPGGYSDNPALVDTRIARADAAPSSLYFSDFPISEPASIDGFVFRMHPPHGVTMPGNKSESWGSDQGFVVYAYEHSNARKSTVFAMDQNGGIWVNEDTDPTVSPDEFTDGGWTALPK